MTDVLVTGGTGNLGRHLLPLLVEAGLAPRVLARHQPEAEGTRFDLGDTVKGVGLDDAFAGADVVVHLAGGAKGDDVAARNVAEAARRARVGHLVLISVVGADRMPIGYFRAKATAERTVAAARVPWTVLRAAQFHDFVLRTVGALVRLPVVPALRSVRFEPVAVEDVAERLAQITLAGPQGRVPDIAGPDVLSCRQVVDSLALGRRPVLELRLPGAVGRAYRDGLNLAGADAHRGLGTWASFIADRAARSGAPDADRKRSNR